MKRLELRSAARFYGIFLFMSIAVLTFILIFAPNDIRGVESNVIYSVQQTLKLNSLLYTNPEIAPYAITQYTPLYYIFTDSVLSTLNLEGEKDFSKVRVLTRVVSLLFNIITLILINSLLIRQLNVDRQLSITYCLTFFVLSSPWFILSRPDALAAFFSLAAIYQVVRYLNSGQKEQLFWGGIVCAFAIFSKQSGVFIFFSISAFLAYTLNLRGLLVVILGLITGLVACLILLYILNYNSNYILENIINGVNNGVSIGNFLFKTVSATAALYGFILMSAIVLSCFAYRYFKDDAILKYLIFTNSSLLFFTTIAALKQGSAENYYIDCVALSLIILAYFTTKVKCIEKRHFVWSISIWAALIYSTSILMIHTFRYSFEIKDSVKTLFEIQNEEELRLTEEIDSFIERELDEGDFFYSSDRRLKLRFPYNNLLPQDEIVSGGGRGTYARKIFSYDMLYNDVMNGKFKYYISEGLLPNQLFGTNLEANFSFHVQIGKYYIYKNEHTMLHANP